MFTTRYYIGMYRTTHRGDTDMDIFDKIAARKPKPVKLVVRTAYTVRIGRRDLAGRIVSRVKAQRIARYLTRQGLTAEAVLFGRVNLTPQELVRFG